MKSRIGNWNKQLGSAPSNRNIFPKLLTHDLIEAIYEEKEFADIEGMIESGITTQFPKTLHWDLIASSLRKSRSDVLELLLEKGLDPNYNCTYPVCRKDYGISALAFAVDLGNLEAVHILLRYQAEVDRDEHSSTDIGSSSVPPLHHSYQNALEVALRKDDIELVKLLIDRYHLSRFQEERSAFYLACSSGAVKCVKFLLNDPTYESFVNLFEIPLHLGIEHGGKLIRILYERGSRERIYSPMALGECLHLLLQRHTFRKGNPLLGFPADLPDTIKTLLELGTSANYVDLARGNTPLETALTNHWENKDVLLDIITLLLSHGSTARINKVCSFLANTLRPALVHHFYNPLSTRHDAVVFLFTATATFEKYLSQILHDPTPCLLDRPRSLDFSQMRRGRDLLQPPACPEYASCNTIQEATRLVVVSFGTKELLFFSNISHIIPRCSCQHFPEKTLLSVWPHKNYQKFLDSTNHLQVPHVHVPRVRSLKALVRVTLFSCLKRPRDVSVASLRLPKILKNFVCLL